jgi:hypothetical protein
MSKTLPLILTVPVIAMVGIMITTLPMPAQAECVTVGCQTHCWPIPGGRRCQWWCQRRCYHPAPEYVPPPTYYPPEYVEPIRHYAPGPSPDGGLVALGVLLVIVLVIVAAASEGSDKVDEVHKATDKALASGDDARSLAQRGSAAAKDIDRYIDQALKDAYARGRRGEDDHG